MPVIEDVSTITFKGHTMVPKAVRQGNRLGEDHRHWVRATFGGNRFRLFFRADSEAKVIVYAWVNDRDALQAVVPTSRACSGPATGRSVHGSPGALGGSQ